MTFLIRFTLFMLLLLVAMVGPARSYPITQNHVYVNGEILTATILNPNLQTIYSWANGGVDNTNIGSAGIFASQLKPTNTAQATFGGVFGYTFGPGFGTAQVPLTIACAAGISVDCLDVTINGVNFFNISSTGAATFGGTLATGLASGRCVQTTTLGVLTVSGGVCNTVTSVTSINGLFQGFTLSGDPATLTAAAAYGATGDLGTNAYYIENDTSSKIFIAKCSLSVTTGVTCGTNSGLLTDANYGSGTSIPLAADSTHLYAAANSPGAQSFIKLYNTSTLALTSTFTITNATCQVSGMAINPQDSNNLYFACNTATGPTTILYKMTSAGVFTTVATLASANNVYSLVVDPNSSNLWLMIPASGTLLKYTNTGTLTASYTSGSPGLSGLCTTCIGLQFDAAGNPWTGSVSGATSTLYKLAGTTPVSLSTFTITTASASPSQEILYASADGNMYWLPGPQGSIPFCAYGVVAATGAAVQTYCASQSTYSGGSLIYATGSISNSNTVRPNPAAASIAGLTAFGMGANSVTNGGNLQGLGFFGPTTGTPVATKTFSCYVTGQFPGTTCTAPGSAFSGINTYLCTGLPQSQFPGSAASLPYLAIDNVSTTSVRVSMVQNGTVVLSCPGS